MIQITVQSTPVQAALNELTRRCQHMQPAFNAVGVEIQRHVIDCFEHEKSPDGINWAALKPATVAKRRKGSSEVLRDTGAMYASLGHNATNNRVDITIGQDYAPFHQFGTSKMLARPFFPNEILPHNWEADILDILNLYLQT